MYLCLLCHFLQGRRHLEVQIIFVTSEQNFAMICLWACRLTASGSSPVEDHLRIVLMTASLPTWSLPPICSQAVGMSPARPIGLRPSLGTKIEPGGGQFITPCWNELQLKRLTKPLSWNALEGAAQIFGLRPPLGGTSPYIISLTIVFKASCQY